MSQHRLLYCNKTFLAPCRFHIWPFLCFLDKFVFLDTTCDMEKYGPMTLPRLRLLSIWLETCQYSWNSMSLEYWFITWNPNHKTRNPKYHFHTYVFLHKAKYRSKAIRVMVYVLHKNETLSTNSKMTFGPKATCRMAVKMKSRIVSKSKIANANIKQLNLIFKSFFL